MAPPRKGILTLHGALQAIGVDWDIGRQFWCLPRVIWGPGMIPEHLLGDLHGAGGDSEAADEVDGPGNETQ